MRKKEKSKFSGEFKGFKFKIFSARFRERACFSRGKN